MAALLEGECVSVVALSNMGKSTLLRQAASPAGQQRYLNQDAGRLALFYVDCNLMLTLSEQGFYEAALRSAISEVRRLGVPDALLQRLQELYHKVIEPPSSFLVPLSFNEAVVMLSEELGRRVVFMFDEFDEPFARLDGRVFLNLRALHDKYGTQLCFVTATASDLTGCRPDAEAAEFAELFSDHVIYLGGLELEEAREVIASIARAEGAKLDREGVEFVLQQAGGHLGLVQSVTAVLIRVAAGAPPSFRERSLRMARQQLDSEVSIRSECTKLWDQLSPEERGALVRFLADGSSSSLDADTQSLLQKGILVRRDTLSSGTAPEPGVQSLAVFGELFAGYARRQHRYATGGGAQSPRPGVYVDVESGDVWVDGKPAPTLTDHEYRLLLLLYGRINKIVTRDDVAETVWGADYMEDIDDARCDKLLSRLRAKIEPDPANPKYLQTVRGRGYKLVSG